MLLHASAVAFGSVGVLITGESGSGKTTLCIELLQQGGLLIADDQVVISQKDGALYAAPPAELEGLLEIYGAGVVELSNVAQTPVPLAFEVHLSAAPAERMPEAAWSAYQGCNLQRFEFQGLCPFNAAKIALMAQLFQQKGRITWVDVAKPAITS